MSIIYTGGTFDLFHSGHVNFLRKCKQLAGVNGSVIVALNSDEFIEKYKGKAPVMSYDERFDVLMSCKYVDLVVENTGGADSKETVIDVLESPYDVFVGVSRIDMVVIGSDWHSKDYLKQMGFTWEWLDKQGIGICYVPYTLGISTTAIKKRIESHDR